MQGANLDGRHGKRGAIVAAPSDERLTAIPPSGGGLRQNLHGLARHFDIFNSLVSKCGRLRRWWDDEFQPDQEAGYDGQDHDPE
jgi:hypothetical protein